MSASQVSLPLIISICLLLYKDLFMLVNVWEYKSLYLSVIIHVHVYIYMCHLIDRASCAGECTYVSLRKQQRQCLTVEQQDVVRSTIQEAIVSIYFWFQVIFSLKSYIRDAIILMGSLHFFFHWSRRQFEYERSWSGNPTEVIGISSIRLINKIS